MLWSDFCDYSDADIVDKGTIAVVRSNDNGYDKKLASKIIRYLLAAYQRLITH